MIFSSTHQKYVNGRYKFFPIDHIIRNRLSRNKQVYRKREILNFVPSYCFTKIVVKHIKYLRRSTILEAGYLASFYTRYRSDTKHCFGDAFIPLKQNEKNNSPLVPHCYQRSSVIKYMYCFRAYRVL